MGSPAAKGRRGEQEIARLLYKAWYGEDPPKERTVFVRTGFGRRQPHGDIIVPDDFPYAVEVKNINYDVKDLPRLLDTFVEGKESFPVATFVKLNHKWYVLVFTHDDVPAGLFHIHTPRWNVVLYPLKEFLEDLKRVRCSLQAEGW